MVRSKELQAQGVSVRRKLNRIASKADTYGKDPAFGPIVLMYVDKKGVVKTAGMCH